MSTVLTDFVRQMAPGPPEPSRELFEQVWDALRGLLCAEMKRRSNWAGPPVYLGVVGHPIWTLPGAESDALDELVAQCFEWIFVTRLDSLCEQARTKPSVDGLVALNIRHFLLEVQRRNDPLGFRLFEVLRRVVEKGLEKGVLRVAEGDARIRNDSLIVLAATDSGSQLATFDPEPLVDRWIGDHLEGLLTATHKTLGQLLDRLSNELAEQLEAEGRALRFGDLASIAKRQGRSAWSALLRDSVFVGDPSIRASDTPEPERLARFARLSRCVERSIDGLEERVKTRLYLARLWQFLESFATSGTELGALGDEQELPSHRQLSKLLDIPRERIPGLLGILGGRLKACRRKIGSTTEEPPMPPKDEPAPPRDRAWASALAAREGLSAADGSDASDPKSWAVGDILALERPDVPGVCWLVLEGKNAEGGHRCAPVDAFALLGPRDLPLFEGDEAPWSLRLGFELSLVEAALRSARRLDQVDADRLAALLRSDSHEGLQRVDEDLPAYREWIEEGPARAYQALGTKVVALPARDASESPAGEARDAETGDGDVDEGAYEIGAGRYWTHLLAAVLAFSVVGLGFHSSNLGDRLVQMNEQIAELDATIEQLSEPILDIPYGEVRFLGIPRGPTKLKVPETATHVQIGMVVPVEPIYERYQVQLLSGQSTLYESPEIAPTGTIDITFPLGRLDHPDLRLHLYGFEGDAAIFVDEEKFEIVRGDGP